jgi:hypothetical protein
LSGGRYFPDSRENIFAGCESDPLSLQNAWSISRLGGFSEPAGSGIFVPVDMVGSELAAEFGTGLPLA